MGGDDQGIRVQAADPGGGRDLKLRIDLPLFGGFLGIVAFMVVMVVALVGTRLRPGLVHIFERELERELALARQVVADAGALHPDSVAGLITERIGYRTTLIDRSGEVLGDSDVLRGELSELENHAGRPEVLQALEGGVGFAERESATLGIRFLYGALPARLDGRPVILRIAAPLADVDATVSRTRGAVATTGLVAMVVALLLAYLSSRALARPVVTLADRAAQLAAGDLTTRAPRASWVSELDQLSAAFNRLAEELQGRLAELSRERDEMRTLIDCLAEGVVALTDDARVLRVNPAARRLLEIPEPPPFAPVGSIVRRPELRALLEESVVRSLDAREVDLGDRSLIVSSRMLDQGGAVTTFLDVTEIRRLERVRQDFVANASHELKTPLTSLRGFAETLLEDDPPEEVRREFLRSIHDNSRRLQRLVDDLLDLSRLESGGWMTRAQELHISTVAHETWEKALAEAGDPDVAFEVEGEAVAVADEQGLRQIFQNLFDNALRYTPERGEVSVTIRREDERAEISVSDTGSGIPSKALPRIFERFYRADPARDRDMGGTGLGLSIVRHLVSAMGGEVTAESELGKGTTIRFTLPLVQVDADL